MLSVVSARYARALVDVVTDPEVMSDLMRNLAGLDVM